MRKIKQQYHLEPDRGLLNDPNGLAYFKGKYHIFFQWNRFSKDHTYKEWGLFTSKDLITWQFEGSAIVPDQSYDLQGVYSGSGYVIQDQLYLFYTGNSKAGGIRKSRQCLAVSADGKRFLKEGPVLDTPDEYTEHFRDPKVWKGKKKGFFMIVGGQQKSGKGALALCRSEDGRTWNYTNMLAVSEQYEMIECPDLFLLNDKYVLMYNPQKRDNEKDIAGFSFSAYKLVDFDEGAGTLQNQDLDKDCIPLDYGFDFYAPQTMETPDGRRILFAWMSRMEEIQEKIFSEHEPNIHCLSIPRELHIQDNRLLQKPVREQYELLGEKISIVSESCNSGKAYPQSRCFYLHMKKLDMNQNICLDIHHEDILIQYDSEKKVVSFSRKSWINNRREYKMCPLYTLTELEIWSDYSSIEVFLNGGEKVFTSRIFPGEGDPEVQLAGITEYTEIFISEINSKSNSNGKGKIS